MSCPVVYQVSTLFGEVLKETISRDSAELFRRKMMFSEGFPYELFVEECKIV